MSYILFRKRFFFSIGTTEFAIEQMFLQYFQDHDFVCNLDEATNLKNIWNILVQKNKTKHVSVKKYGSREWDRK